DTYGSIRGEVLSQDARLAEALGPLALRQILCDLEQASDPRLELVDRVESLFSLLCEFTSRLSRSVHQKLEEDVVTVGLEISLFRGFRGLGDNCGAVCHWQARYDGRESKSSSIDVFNSTGDLQRL